MAMKILLVSKLHLLFRIARNKSGDGCNEMVTKFKYLGIGFSKDFFFSLIYLVLSLFQQVACSRTLLKFQKKKNSLLVFSQKFSVQGYMCIHVYMCPYIHYQCYISGRERRYYRATSIRKNFKRTSSQTSLYNPW